MYCPKCGNDVIKVYSTMPVSVTLLGEAEGLYDIDEIWPDDTDWWPRPDEQASCCQCYHHATVAVFQALTDPPTR